MVSNKEKTKVTRIKASEPKVAKKASKVVKPAISKASKKPVVIDKTKADTEASASKRKNIFVRIKRYFAGAWYELRQVRWPDRRATWGMTGALLVFTTIFVVLILLLDALFKYLFELIIV